MICLVSETTSEEILTLKFQHPIKTLPTIGSPLATSDGDQTRVILTDNMIPRDALSIFRCWIQC